MQGQSSRRGLWGVDQRGVALGWVCVALVTIVGIAGMAFDIGALEIAAQRCQEVADSAALGAATELPTAAVTPTALGMVEANNTEGHGWGVACSSSDVNVYGPGSTVGGVTLDGMSNAVEVTVHGPVTFTFLRMLGLEEATAHRTAVAMRGVSGSGFPLVTMWIDRETAEECYTSGIYSQILTAGDLGIPGSYGYLQPPDGSTSTFVDLLQGYDLSEQDLATSQVAIGDIIYAYTGESGGQLKSAFESDHGRARLERGSTGIYAGDTADSYHPGNPRVILVPLVTYGEDSGHNAALLVEGFSVFFLESIDHAKGEIYATFLDFYIPGDTNFGTPTFDGFFSVKLIG